MTRPKRRRQPSPEPAVPPPGSPALPWLTGRGGLLLLLLATCALYWPGLAGEFVVDDVPVIQTNPYLDWAHLGRYFATDTWASTALEASGTPVYRPLFLVVLTAAHGLFADNPAGYHLLSLALHLANTALVFALLRALGAGEGAAALFGAALFALHPTRVESVAWIAGMNDPLVLAFLLGALLAHRRIAQGGAPGWQVAALLLFAAALLTKEVAIAFPVVVACHDRLLGGRLRWRRLAPLAAMAALYLAARTLALGGHGAESALLAPVARTLDILLGYVRLTVLPAEVPFYLVPPATSVGGAAGAAGLVLAAAVVATAWRLAPAARPPLGVGLAWTACFLWPALLLACLGDGFFSARFLYVPAPGLAIVVALAYAGVVARYPAARLGAALAGLLLAAAGAFVASREIGQWRNEAIVYGRIAALVPASPVGHAGLAKYFFDRDQHATAAPHLEDALARATRGEDRADLLVMRGTLRAMAGDLAASRRDFDEALRVAPGRSEAWNALGNLHWMQGEIGAATSAWEKAVALRRSNLEATANLAMAYQRLGDAARATELRRRVEAARR